MKSHKKWDRLKLRRTRPVTFLLVLTMMTVVIFQNCSGYQPALDINQDEYASLIAEDCDTKPCFNTTPSANMMRISIENHMYNRGTEVLLSINTQQVLQPFDVAGFCDSGGFASTRIYYSFQKANAAPVWWSTGGGCDSMGRYRIYVPLPSGFNRCEPHLLRVQIRGLRSNGQEVGPASGSTNEAAIQILSENLAFGVAGC